MSGEQHSVREHIRAITDDEVNISRNNVRHTVEKVGDILAKLPLEQHKAVMAGLGIEMDLRQQAMQIAMEEFKHRQQLEAQKERENAAAAAKLAPQLNAGAAEVKPGPVALAK